MSREQWNTVDKYLSDLLVKSDSILEKSLEVNAIAKLPAHDVSPAQGKFLYLLALIKGARTILEIGTLGGYSTIWMARALPENGKLITLESDPRYADVARHNIAYANLSHLVEVRVGHAIDTLPQLVAENCGPFDLIFIDADKSNNPDYLSWALKLSRRGSVIIGDNIVRNGGITDSKSSDPNIQGVRQFIALQASEPRLSATALQTVGSKGYDGFSIAIVTADP